MRVANGGPAGIICSDPIFGNDRTIFMPCCAFAAFIVSQIVLGFTVIKKSVLRSGDDLNEVSINPATEWRLIGGAPALPLPARRRVGLLTLALAASIEILLAAGAVYGYHLHAHHHHVASLRNQTVCIRVRQEIRGKKPWPL